MRLDNEEHSEQNMNAAEVEEFSMSILRLTLVACALVIIELSIGDATLVNGRRPQEPKPPYPYYEQEVFFLNEKDRVRLAGTLSLPLAKGPFPGVLLITGSGPVSYTHLRAHETPE